MTDQPPYNSDEPHSSVVTSELPPLPGEIPFDAPLPTVNEVEQPTVSNVGSSLPPEVPFEAPHIPTPPSHILGPSHESPDEHQSPIPDGEKDQKKKPEEKKPQSSENVAKLTIIVVLILLFALGIIIPLVILSRTFIQMSENIASWAHIKTASHTVENAQPASSNPYSGFISLAKIFSFENATDTPASISTSSVITVGIAHPSSENGTTTNKATSTSTPVNSTTYSTTTATTSSNSTSSTHSSTTPTPTIVKAPYADLAVRIIGLGTTDVNNTFTPASYVPPGSPVAVEFVVTNVGTLESGSWSISASLPSTTNPAYDSLGLVSLAPGKSVAYVLSFSNPISGNSYISITAHSTNDTHPANDTAVARMQSQ